MRPLLAAVTLGGAVSTGGHRPSGELDLPPPARVGLVFKNVELDFVNNQSYIKVPEALLVLCASLK